MTPGLKPDAAVDGGAGTASSAMARLESLAARHGEAAVLALIEDGMAVASAALAAEIAGDDELRALVESLASDRAFVRSAARSAEARLFVPAGFADRVLVEAARDVDSWVEGHHRAASVAAVVSGDDGDQGEDDPPAPLVFVPRPRRNFWNVAGGVRTGLAAAAAIAVLAGGLVLVNEAIEGLRSALDRATPMARDGGSGADGGDEARRPGASDAGLRGAGDSSLLAVNPSPGIDPATADGRATHSIGRNDSSLATVAVDRARGNGAGDGADFGGPPDFGLAVRVRSAAGAGVGREGGSANPGGARGGAETSPADTIALLRALDADLARFGGAVVWNGAASIDQAARLASAEATQEGGEGPQRTANATNVGSPTPEAGSSPARDTDHDEDAAGAEADRDREGRDLAREFRLAEAVAQSRWLLTSDLHRLSGHITRSLLEPSDRLPSATQSADWGRGFSFTLVGTPSVLRDALGRLNRRPGVSVRLLGGVEGGPRSLSDLAAPRRPATPGEWQAAIVWWRDPARHRVVAEEAGRSFQPEPVIRLPLLVELPSFETDAERE